MTPTIEETKSLVLSVEGWLDNYEGELLYSLAQNCQGTGAIVEVGSWKGKSTIWLASGSKAGRGVKVYAVDPHTGSSEHRELYGKISTFDEFKNNTSCAGLDDLVVPMVMTSREAASSFDQPVELLFIDGAHEYEAVNEDFELWFPKVVEGGVVAFHDVAPNWPGPVRVVRESVYKSRRFHQIRLLSSITYARKIRRNSWAEWLRNASLVWVKDAMEASRGINWPKPVRRIGGRVARQLDSRLFSYVR